MTGQKVALAFSGGLDTTVCVPLLKEEYGYDEVIGVTVDVGQPDAEFAEAHETADALGVEHFVVDAKAEFAERCFDAVKANATYQGYPLGTALARPVIAEAILEVAEEQGCAAVAHGCTGKGNDQLRFEAVWRASDLEVLAPSANSASRASGRSSTPRRSASPWRRATTASGASTRTSGAAPSRAATWRTRATSQPRTSTTGLTPRRATPKLSTSASRTASPSPSTARRWSPSPSSSTSTTSPGATAWVAPT